MYVQHASLTHSLRISYRQGVIVIIHVSHKIKHSGTTPHPHNIHTYIHTYEKQKNGQGGRERETSVSWSSIKVTYCNVTTLQLIAKNKMLRASEMDLSVFHSSQNIK